MTSQPLSRSPAFNLYPPSSHLILRIEPFILHFSLLVIFNRDRKLIDSTKILKKRNTIFILTWQSIIRLKLLIRLFARSYRIRLSPVKNALDKKLSSSDSSSSRTKLYVYTYNHIWSSSLFVDISYVCLFIRDADALKRNKCGRTRREGERGTILLFHRGIKFGALSALIQPRLPI